MATKIVLIGAGSVSFGTGTLCDLFGAHEALRGSTLALVDTDLEALERMMCIARRMNEALASLSPSGRARTAGDSPSADADTPPRAVPCHLWPPRRTVRAHTVP